MIKTIDAYLRALEMVDNLKLNLKELNAHKLILLNELIKIEKQISKHESFLKILEEDLST